MAPSAQRKLYGDTIAREWHERNMAGETFTIIADKDGVDMRQVTNTVSYYRKKHSLEGPGADSARGQRDFTRSQKSTDLIEAPPAFIPAVTLTRQEWERANTCRYIQGDPKADDAVFCGHEKTVASAYCEGHHAVCWRAPPKPKPYKVGRP